MKCPLYDKYGQECVFSNTNAFLNTFSKRKHVGCLNWELASEEINPNGLTVLYDTVKTMYPHKPIIHLILLLLTLGIGNAAYFFFVEGQRHRYDCAGFIYRMIARW